MSFFLRNRAELARVAKSAEPVVKGTQERVPSRMGLSRFVKAFDPDQPRDENGRWTEFGPGGKHHDAYKSFERQPGLTDADRKVEDESIKTYLKHKGALTEEYQKRFGTKVVNADLARRLFHETEGADIAKHVGYNGRNSAAVQEAASALNKDAWRKALQNPEADAILYAGGSGSGKSTAVKQLIPDIEQHAAAVLDGNLSSLKSATARLSEIADAGKNAKVVYVYRDPADAWVNGVVKRMRDNKEEGGRIVPMSVFLQNSAGSLGVVKTLADGGVDVIAIDNSKGKGRASIMSRTELDKLSMPDMDKLRDHLVAETKKLVGDGPKSITKEQYDALIR